MSNHDPKTGRFVKGNNANSDLAIPDELRNRLKKNRQKLIKIFDQYGNMDLKEIEHFTKHKMGLTPVQITVLKFWKTLMEKSDPALLKMMFHLYGIPIDVKAVQITDNMLGNPSPESSDEEEAPMSMTKDQKKKALLIALEAVENEED